mmetsp:Transcript_3110/g.9504  ORF Transcript_3110/g.9504 Transcript_3110/m.9504 type:complete len:700 (+) Transcript_3110:314-2413(+)
MRASRLAMSGTLYVVRRGRKPGIYSTWNECEEQVRGYVGGDWVQCESMKEALRVLFAKPADQISRYIRAAQQMDAMGERIIASARPSQPPEAGTTHAEDVDGRSGPDPRHQPSKVPRSGSPMRSGLLPRVSASADAQNRPPHDMGLLSPSSEFAPTGKPVRLSEKLRNDAKGATSARFDEVPVTGGAFGSSLAAPDSPADLEAAAQAESVNLCEEQRRAIDVVRSGKNLFLTGCGGTGKSTVLRVIIREMRALLGREAVGVTAMTGVAAENVGGCTLHSLLGLGIPFKRQDFKKMARRTHAMRLRELDLLIVDEVSMLSGEMLDLIDEQLRTIRGDRRSPFGGLQVLFSGDFYQLPPVRQQNGSRQLTSAEQQRQHDEGVFLNLGMAFQSEAWQSARLETVDLQVVHRQKDMELVLALSDMRRGILSPRLERVIQAVQRPLPPEEDGIQSTLLFSHNRDVDRLNNEKLRQLPRRGAEFEADDYVVPSLGASSSVQKQLSGHSFWKTCRAPKRLQLKVGAQVMLLKNINQSEGSYLVNGSRGVVEAFEGEGCDRIPVVRFRNGQVRRVAPAVFSTTIPGMGSCYRNQIPLVLAWAMSVHKSQGMSLDRLKVDLSGVFDFGQSYVALSRARFMETLEVKEIPLTRLGLFKNQDVEDFCEDMSLGEGFTKTKTWKQLLSEERPQPRKSLHVSSPVVLQRPFA